MRNLAPVIVLVLLWSALFAVEVINPGGIRNRLSPDHDRFLQRLPPPVRLVWFLLLLTFAALTLAVAIFQTDALPFLETPLGQLMGTWILAGLILVFVTDFTRGSIDEIPIAIKT